MTDERWERIKTVFDSALHMQDAERKAYLDEACRGDKDMRVEIERLREAYADANSLLDAPASDAGRGQVLACGEVLSNRYRVLGLLGQGGMGTVYKAYDSLTGETVALKTLRAGLTFEGEVFRRFRSEIQVSRKVTHHNVCRLLDVGVHSPGAGSALHFFTMELLDGETLAERIHRIGPMSWAEAKPLILQMAEGLSAAHRVGVVHGDFKTANVIISKDRAVITDFGLARLTQTSLASTVLAAAPLAGTLAYMSPEQFSGEAIGPQSDIFSFGVVLYEMASGRRPFEDRPLVQAAVERASRKPKDVRKLVADIDPYWANTIDGCLEPDTRNRFATMDEALATLQQGTHSTSSVVPKRAGKLLMAGLGVIFLVVLSLFGLRSRLFNQGPRDGATVLVTPTINVSGDTQFDGISSVFRATVGQSPRWQLWDDGRLGAVLQAMRRDPQRVPVVEDWREIAFREGASVLMFTTLSRVGTSYALAVHAEQIGGAPAPPVRTWDRTFTSEGPGGLFDAVRSAASWIRSEAGETEPVLSAYNRLPQDITTANWEALGLYEQGYKRIAASDLAGAVPFLRRALDVDPEFALASMRLGDILVSQRDYAEGFKRWRDAIRQGRNQHLADRERLMLESGYAVDTGDFVTAEPVFREWTTRFPNDKDAWERLASCLIDLGRYPEALSIARRNRERFGASLFVQSRILMALAMMRQDDEIAVELDRLKPLNVPYWELRFRGIFAAMREDYDTAQKSFAALAQTGSLQDASRTASVLAALAADRGDLKAAVTILEDGVKRDQQAGEKGFAAQKASALAFLESMRQNGTASKSWAYESVAMLGSDQIVQQAVSVLARQGFAREAVEISARMPEGEGPKHDVFVLKARGDVLAVQGHVKDAVQVMEEASRKETAVRPREYLARVLELDGQHERAVRIYDEIVGAPWLIWVSPESEWPGVRLLSKQRLQSQ